MYMSVGKKNYDKKKKTPRKQRHQQINRENTWTRSRC